MQKRNFAGAATEAVARWEAWRNPVQKHNFADAAMETEAVARLEAEAVVVLEAEAVGWLESKQLRLAVSDAEALSDVAEGLEGVQIAVESDAERE